MDEWKARVLTANPTFKLLTETWLQDSICDSLDNIDGYTTYRDDRQNQNGGGVCILAKNKINGSKINCSISNNYKFQSPIDAIWLDIQICKIDTSLAGQEQPPVRKPTPI